MMAFTVQQKQNGLYIGQQMQSHIVHPIRPDCYFIIPKSDHIFPTSLYFCKACLLNANKLQEKL